MPTIETARAYLGIDYVDEVTDANIQRALRTAEKTVLGAVGSDVATYLPEDPRVEELTLIYMEDLYSQRGVAPKVSAAIRHSMQTMELQLQQELASAKAKAEGASA